MRERERQSACAHTHARDSVRICVHVYARERESVCMNVCECESVHGHTHTHTVRKKSIKPHIMHLMTNKANSDFFIYFFYSIVFKWQLYIYRSEWIGLAKTGKESLHTINHPMWPSMHTHPKAKLYSLAHIQFYFQQPNAWSISKGVAKWRKVGNYSALYTKQNSCQLSHNLQLSS